MHVRSLKVFCDVVARKSFSRAADDHGISQSGASQIVHQLEDYLGVKLIDRSTRPFGLTAEGQAYYEGCRGIVEQLDALKDRVRALHNEVEGRVQVASIYSVGLSFMKEFVQDFSSRFSKARVRLEYGHPDRVVELVQQDQVDLGLVSYARTSRKIEAIQWRNEPMVLVMAVNHPWAGRPRVGLAELDGVDAVGFDQDLRIRGEVDKALHKRGVALQVLMEFDNIETLKRAIEINNGVSILPEPTVRREVLAGQLALATVEGLDLERPVSVIRRKGRELGRTAQRFLDHLLAHPYLDHEPPAAGANSAAAEDAAGKGTSPRAGGLDRKQASA